ncbi:MAG: penicillin-binding protein 1B [Oceanospirillaceae bacterium]|nr:penicillin-binding protein 1B [Oceanospirillaceae bacterium]MBT4998525.1 penicillin-binding protein 1B [Oceanospirillaceae bacterium]MBT5628871.1 penicillin-binding protein 1B [Oceanospirillaceae bacterium]MBT6100719.1 penicillin-binding protein 1B [Oceanospirillaceae bacterium]MBT7674240.1 penicillin-binding protein 1B [Oceanospirillaceae bacterium]
MSKQRVRNKVTSNSSLGWISWIWIFKLTTVLLVLGVVALIYIDAQIRHRFEGHRWSLPAKVYARPLELFTGQQLAQGQLKFELTQLGYRWVTQAKAPGQVQKTNQGMIIYSRGFRFVGGDEQGHLVEVNLVGDKIVGLRQTSGASIAVLRLEPQLVGGIYPAHNEDRELIQLDDLPNGFIETLLAVEDRQYYAHYGVSPWGIMRAMWANIRAGAVVQGGSTLTQQLVKNFYLTDQQTLWRKLIEAPMALLLNIHYSKDEVLEVYLNEVFAGQSGKRAIHGFGLASRFYFGQPVSELKLHQVALLVGLVKGPSYYNPRRHPKRATNRRNLVLSVLAQQGLISETQKTNYQALPLDLTEAKQVSRYPAYMDLVRQQLKQHYQASSLSSHGLRIFTSLDPWVQQQADKAMLEQVGKLKQRYSNIEGLQGAAVVSHRDSGELLALVGDYNGGYAGHNWALDESRQVGSLLKPIVHLAALETGRYSPNSIIDDAPIALPQPDGSLWQPQNYDRKSHGKVPMYETLVKSYNQANVRLGLDVGVDKVLQQLQRMGVEQSIPAYPSVLLGAVEMSPLQVNQVYQTIASNGFYSPLSIVRQVTEANGRLLSNFPFAVRQVASNESIYMLQHEMRLVASQGTAKGVYRYLPKQQKVAAKTGTTNDQKDSWFAGFSGLHVATVWLGREDAKPTPLTGAGGALNVWGQLMQNLAYAHDEDIKPQTVAHYYLNRATGEAIPDKCPNGVWLPMLKTSAPSFNASCGY